MARTLEQMKYRAMKDLIEMLEKHIETKVRVFNNKARWCVYSWYKSYPPKLYHRKRTLYHAYKITREGWDIRISFSSEDIYPIHSIDRFDREYIFENSFLQGYHGGAISGEGHPMPGIPWWRKPPPDYTEWSRPAKKTLSPYERISIELHDYNDRVEEDLVKRFKRKILPQLERILNYEED